MAVKASIQLTHTDADQLYVDSDSIVSIKKAIKNDLTNICNDLDNIEKHYKALRDHKSTKGKWQDLAKSCVKKCNQYETKMKKDKVSLEDCVDDAVQSYVLTQIEGLREAQAKADALKTGV